jgi:glycosyltransferase involved in cell wall biosynthesis
VKKKRLNILFISGWYPNRVIPTLGNFVQKHAEAVALKSNVIVLNVWPDKNCTANYEITESNINNVYAINIYYKKVLHNIPIFSQIQKFIRIQKAYKKGLEIVHNYSSHIDLIHHNILYPSGIATLMLSRIKKIPFIVTEHSTAYLSSKKLQIGRIEKYISKRICANAVYITPVSIDLKNAMISHGYKGNYEIIYNVVDTKLFYPGDMNVRTEKIRFLHISTLDDAHKNISGILNAIAALSNTTKDFEFFFAGDGDLIPHVEKAKKLGIYNSLVFFEGTKTTSEIAELMRRSDCFVMFSNFENLPVVIVEALASGLPVVSSRVGGIHEHIDESRGILVDAKNEVALTKALCEIMSKIKNDNYNSKLLSAYAEKNFSYERVCEQFHLLYDRILNND